MEIVEIFVGADVGPDVGEKAIVTVYVLTEALAVVAVAKADGFFCRRETKVPLFIEAVS